MQKCYLSLIFCILANSLYFPYSARARGGLGIGPSARVGEVGPPGDGREDGGYTAGFTEGVIIQSLGCKCVISSMFVGLRFSHRHPLPEFP